MHMLEANHLGALGQLITDLTGEVIDELSPSAAAILLTLLYRPGLTTTELAEVGAVSQPTAVRVVGGLVRRGLVVRSAPERRARPLALTEAGRHLAQTVQAARLARLEALLALLPSDRRLVLGEIVGELLRASTTSRRQARTTCRLCDHAACVGPGCPIGSRAREIEREQGTC